MKIATFFLIVLCGAISFSGKKANVYEGFNLKKFEKSLSLIPEENLNYIVNQAVPIEKQPIQKIKTVNVQSFYISNHEVSNGEYLEFVNELKKTGSDLYAKMLPDSMVWLQRQTYGEPYRVHYFRHPAYSNYPVVGVTYEQAEHYCKWLTEKYMKEEKRKFESVIFKLPEINQWVSAAKGVYFLQDSKGNWRANFTPVSQISMCREIDLGNKTFRKDVEPVVWVQKGDYLFEPLTTYRGVDITAPVIFYTPNKYGLYNMFGNVEEYVKEKGITKGGSWRDTGYYLQIDVEEKYDSTNYTSAERGFRFVMELNN